MRTLLTLLLLALPALAGDPTPVTLRVFSDFQCPFCARFAQPLRELQAKTVDGVVLDIQFAHFPLHIHPDAQLAHQAALAAGVQNRFWEMHDLLFANQSALKRDDLLRYAGQLHLDVARFQRDLDSDGAKQRIATDIGDGQRLGVQGTPTFFVNGKRNSGTKTYDELKELVLAEHRRARALTEIPPASLSKGPNAATATVTLDLFADLRSPVTRPTLDVLNRFLEDHPHARLQFHSFPLGFHPQSGLAHEAAMFAARHGKFWEMAGFLADRHESLRTQDVLSHAQTLGLNPEALADALDRHTYAPRVEADIDEARRRGLRGSPVLFVNGHHRIDGVPGLPQLNELLAVAPVSDLVSDRRANSARVSSDARPLASASADPSPAKGRTK